MSPAPQTQKHQLYRNIGALPSRMLKPQKGQLRDAGGAAPRHDPAPARPCSDDKSPITVENTPVLVPTSRASEIRCWSRSYLSGFVELLLQPRYRHGRYAVILTEKRSRFCRRVRGGKTSVLLGAEGDLQSWSSPAGSPARKRLTAAPLRLLDDGGTRLQRR